jgi:hypothetical protein
MDTAGLDYWQRTPRKNMCFAEVVEILITYLWERRHALNIVFSTKV